MRTAYSNERFIFPFLSSFTFIFFFFFAVWRGWRTKIDFRRIQEAAIVLQRHVRRHFTLKRLKEECLVELSSNMSTEEFDQESFPQEGSALTESSCALPLSPSYSPIETTSRHFGFVSSLASRAMASWFDPLKTKPDEFTPPNHWASPYKRQMTSNSSRGHIGPLAMLMGFGQSYCHPRIHTAADGQIYTMQSVNKSCTIISRRDIEKVSSFIKRASV